MFYIDQIKESFCRYKCNKYKLKKQIIDDIEVFVEYNDLPNESICNICQIDNFIKELREFDKLKE